MPGLDLLAEEELDFASVFLVEVRKDGAVEGIEHLGGEGTDIVQIWEHILLAMRRHFEGEGRGATDTILRCGRSLG